MRVIAFNLPQFHPIPENDRWWGKGFTEWTNVARAKPQFPGHRQPRRPADLGYYDLRLPEARAAQAELARAHRIEGFCYWHYWFHGKRLLERPVDEILRLGEPDFPFCLAWANESWSRTWLGDEREILIKQQYSAEDDVRHAQWLTRAFADPRYIRVNGRPMFLVYKPKGLPDPARFLRTLRQESERAGVEAPFVVGINAQCVGTDLTTLGFDATEHHEPQIGALAGASYENFSRRRLLKNLRLRLIDGKKRVYRYSDARASLDQLRPKHDHLPCFFVGWDNTPRRQERAVVIEEASPHQIASDFENLVASMQYKPSQERIVFINAWNEWAEGMYLEPDDERGTELLERIAAVIRKYSDSATAVTSAV